MPAGLFVSMAGYFRAVDEELRQLLGGQRALLELESELTKADLLQADLEEGGHRALNEHDNKQIKDTIIESPVLA